MQASQAYAALSLPNVLSRRKLVVGCCICEISRRCLSLKMLIQVTRVGITQTADTGDQGWHCGCQWGYN